MLAVALAASCPAQVAAEDDEPDVDAARVEIAADERDLWMGVSRENSSLLLRARLGGLPGDPRNLNRPIERIARFVDGVLVVFSDGGIYRFVPDRLDGAPEASLPLREIPVALDGDDRRAFAIMTSHAAAALAGRSEAATAAILAGRWQASQLTLVEYDQRDWRIAASCPASMQLPVEDRLRPRLLVLGPALVCAWVAPGEQAVRTALRLDASPTWVELPAIACGPLQSLWLVDVGGVATLAIEAGDGAALRAYRLLGDVRSDGASWREATPTLSAMPEGARAARIEAAAGAGQQFVVLIADQRDEPILRFGRLDGDTLSESIHVTRALAELQSDRVARDLSQTAAFVVVLAVLLTLFTLRRDAMFSHAPLPPELQPALTAQRLVGWMIDFAPCALAASAIAGVSWRESWETLQSWAFATGAQSGATSLRALGWWATACGLYAVYCATAESLTGRTLGKLLLRTSVSTRDGRRPSFAQVCIRNATRPLELVPQLWVISLLVLVSANRQRLGDLLAGTVVVRRVSGDGQRTRASSGGESTDSNRGPRAGVDDRS